MKTFVRGLAVGLLAATTFVLSVVNADEHALQEQVLHKIAAATIVGRGRHLIQGVVDAASASGITRKFPLSSAQRKRQSRKPSALQTRETG